MEVIQQQYSALLEEWPYSQRLFFSLGSILMSSLTAGSFLAHILAFWGCNALLYFIYKFNLFSSYKIQESKWPDPSLVKSSILHLLPSHLLIQPLLFHFIVYDAFMYFGMSFTPSSFPTIWEIVWQITLLMIGNDFIFYWTHRGLHHPSIYRHIHKKHHLYRQSIGIAAEYAHPVEDALNAMAMILPTLLIHPHYFTWLIYILVRISETVDAHSGYNFPFSPWNRLDALQGGADKHEFHHSHNVGNYGMFAFWDWAMGTDQAYWKWRAKKAEDKLHSQ